MTAPASIFEAALPEILAGAEVVVEAAEVVVVADVVVEAAAEVVTD